MRFLLIVFHIIVITSVQANTDIDSIRKQITKAKHDTILCQMYLDYGDFFENTNIDSADYYYKKAQQICEKNLKNNKILNYQEIIKLSDLYSKALRYRAVLYLNNSLSNKPIETLLKSSLSFAKIAKNETAQASCYSNLGVLYFNRSLYDKSLTHQYEALKLFEKTNHINGLANVYMNIANIYILQFKYEKALQSFNKSIKYLKSLNNEYLIARVENNMAILYRNLKKYDIAEQYFKKSLETFKLFKDSINVANIYINLGVLLLNKNDFEQPLNLHFEAYRIFKAKKDTHGVILSLLNMSETLIKRFKYSQHKDIKWIKQAHKYSVLAFNMNNKYGSLNFRNIAANNLMKTSFYLGDVKNSILFVEIYANTKDSLYSEETAKATAEAETKYKTEKQQRLIENLKFQKELKQKKIEKQEIENKRQRTTLYSIFSVALLLIILLLVVAYFLRINQIKNRKLRINNYKILKQKEEISTQRDEIAEQRDLVTKQKIQIEAYHKSLKDSIYYAENIQKAVIPDSQFVENILDNCFVLFQPRDIVSGDYYWIQQDKEYIYLAVADCTGHGVPGAFMSMMAVSFLNELYHKKNITETNFVLDLLRDHLIQSLHLNETSVKMKDGMDMIFIKYHKQSRKLNYVGANNPLYIAQKTTSYNLIELSPNKMPVGYHPNMLPFVSQEFLLSEGDILYFTTDGYCDQFGGPLGKKFMRKKLKELLLSISIEPVHKQKEILTDTIEKWRNQEIVYPQTDDITIIGWKI